MMLRLRPAIFLAGVVALTGGGDIGGGLDDLGVDHARGGLGGTSRRGADGAAEQAAELVEDAVFLPAGEVGRVGGELDDAQPVGVLCGELRQLAVQVHVQVVAAPDQGAPSCWWVATIRSR